MSSEKQAVLRIVPGIYSDEIEKLIDSIEGISSMRKSFYKTMYHKSYELILKSAFAESPL